MRQEALADAHPHAAVPDSPTVADAHAEAHPDAAPAVPHAVAGAARARTAGAGRARARRAAAHRARTGHADAHPHAHAQPPAEPRPSPTPSPSLRPLYHEPPPREADEGTSPVTRTLLFVAPAILAAAALSGSGAAARNRS
ncbi:hypothetical protein DMB38_33510 [Streptomyces sp. WAC 06738]|uniref:hypothetical protein n=1 Tax=Streptomyces sp. WAC 06738 TaxID=2203210 RepID=UPI000F6FC77F|nr:hypothetical protein [Streptomyces sp. WAC 06738]AZM50053.1 hypothetical protein DMB38_33510 [Streptomyces sp. WAC 06738]